MSIFKPLLDLLRPSPSPPPPSSAPAYNEPLEIAHSRLTHALKTQHCIPSHLLASINNKLQKPWVEPEPRWRVQQRVKTAQQHRREARDGRLVGKSISENTSRNVRGRVGEGWEGRDLKGESDHRRETMRKIWECEILILKGQAPAPLHPGIRAEAVKRYGEVCAGMSGMTDEYVEDYLRGRLYDEVDAGREFSIEWEIWRLVLEKFMADLEARELKVEIARNKVPEGALPYDNESQDQTRASIFQKLFVEDVVVTLEEWEDLLRQQIEYFESLGRKGERGLEQTRQIVRELEDIRLRGGFGGDFVRRYGKHAIRGDGSLTEGEKWEIRRKILNARNAKFKRSSGEVVGEAL